MTARETAMYQTMRRQPEDLARLLLHHWPQAEAAANLLSPARRILLAGTGTSYHAAMVGAWLLRAAGHDAQAISSFDLATWTDQWRLSPDDAVIVLAHTGETGFSGRAMRVAADAGTTVVSIGSQMAHHSDSRLVLRTVEPESAATYTASHTAAMAVLAQVAVVLGERRSATGVEGFREGLERLPTLVQAALDREADILPVAELAITRRTYAIAAGPNEATALEVVIKVREASFCAIDGMAAEQFLHGPLLAMHADDLGIVIDASGPASARVCEIARVLEGIGARLWIVGKTDGAPEGALTFSLPELPELLSPLLTVIPMQMLAYQMAALRGTSPDHFRWDDPIYKAAFARLTL